MEARMSSQTPVEISHSGSGVRRATRIAIVGAGMSGLLMAIKLKEAGYRDFTIYEKKSNLGGTWRDNTYPGLKCDVRGVYSFQFEHRVGPAHQWSLDARTE